MWGTSTLGGAAPECELGVRRHTVVGGWVWPGSQRLANQRQGAWPWAVNQEILANEREVRPLRQVSPTHIPEFPAVAYIGVMSPLATAYSILNQPEKRSLTFDL